MTLKSCVLWDMDGVLFDSTELHAEAFRDTLMPLGLAVEYASVAGRKTEDVFESLLRAAGIYSPGIVRELSHRKRQRFLNLASRGDRNLLVPGAQAVLRNLQGRYHQALCTSASPLSVQVFLAELGFDPFETIVTSAQVPQGKPDPAIFLRAVSEMGHDGKCCVVVEDSISGLTAARNANLDAIFFAPAWSGNGITSSAPSQNVKHLKFARLASTLEEIPDMIREWC